jgi:hypothetical protein
MIQPALAEALAKLLAGLTPMIELLIPKGSSS